MNIAVGASSTALDRVTSKWHLMQVILSMERNIGNTGRATKKRAEDLLRFWSGALCTERAIKAGINPCPRNIAAFVRQRGRHSTKLLDLMAS